ncbi:MAG TPA: type II secretion system F family protein [Solirubrobacteraceae bacterium]|nr:type II secretion system F family protein [Solirubrobacteraceae bacterium]
MSIALRSRRAGARIAGVAATLLATIGLLATPVQSAASTLRVSEGGGATFPARALVVSVPGARSLEPAQVHVTENGRAVAGAVVRPLASAGNNDFGVVLAIDTAPTMKGTPLAKAMAAARALASERTGNQQLGVVTFDSHATVALPLTSDPRAIAGALARTPRVGRGAYIYNALSVAVQQLSKAKIAAGAVILLSDGASEGAVPQPGHNVTASSVGAAAAAAHAQIYTVGLRDSSFTPERMSLLARVGGGSFIESTSSELSRVFTQIEAGLTSAYVVHYRSLAPLGHRVDVSVKVDGVADVARLSYLAPAPPEVGQARRHAAPQAFWASTAAIVLVACGLAMLIALALYILIGPHTRRGRLRQRLGAFTASGLVEPQQIVGADPSPLPGLERMLERTRWWAGFKRDVEIARIERAPVALVALTAGCTLALAVLLDLALKTAVVTVLVFIFMPVALRSRVRMRVRKQRSLFAEQLPTHLQELASTMRAGHSLIAGISSMARSAPEPSHTEWTRVVADEQLGLPLQEAMKPMGERMASEDIGQVALVAALHQRTGGNMAEVLERVADSVRERAELRRELHALTAQARLSRYIVTSLPLLMAGAIAAINPGYVRPLFHTTAGVTLLFIAIGMLVVASVVMRAITDIKV